MERKVEMSHGDVLDQEIEHQISRPGSDTNKPNHLPPQP